jgi:hypothetical protein
MAFIQIIEFTTTNIDDIGEWEALTGGRRTAERATFTRDRDRPDRYVQIVEFPSFDDARVNSALPETAAFAERLAQLCDGPIEFRDLDVRSVSEL